MLSTLVAALPLVGAHDPPWAWPETQQVSPAANQFDAFFGADLDLDSDLLIAGASTFVTGFWFYETGAAFVFRREATGWVEEATLTSPTPVDGGRFGAAVALADGRALVTENGGAWIFVRAGTAWSSEAFIDLTDPKFEFDHYTAVVFDGDRAVFGSEVVVGPGTTEIGFREFVRTGSAWSEVAPFLPPEPIEFPLELALDGDRLIVGECRDDALGSNAGAAFVFERTGGAWTFDAKLLPPDGEEADLFGSEVAISGDRAIVSQFGDDNEVGIDVGAAWIFERVGGQWVAHTKLLPPAGGPPGPSAFGNGVALDGDHAAVADRLAKQPGATLGNATIYRRLPTGWQTESTVWGTSPPGFLDFFGDAMELEGDRLAVGFSKDLGRVHVFDRAPSAGAAAILVEGNPLSLTITSQPVLGSTLSLAVDVGGTTGNAAAVLAGALAPAALPLPDGTLVVDLSVPSAEVFGLPSAPGPVARFDVPIPADPVLTGLEVFAQALHFGGGPPPALSNGLLLVLAP